MECGFGPLRGRGWTELAKDNQTGAAGPGVSLVPRSDPGNTLQFHNGPLLQPPAAHGAPASGR